MAGFVIRLAERMGYHYHKNTAYGRTNGIFFNVIMVDTGNAALYGAVGSRMVNDGQSTMPTVRAYVKHENGIDLNAINAFLLQKKWKGLKVYNAQADETAVWMHINNAWTLKAENVETLLNEFSAWLVQNGYYSGCSFCPATEELGYTEQGGRVMEACDECHQRLAGIVEEFKAERDTAGSYVKGALGAAVGGLIGIIPWVLIGMLGYVAALSGLIMSWLSYKGYQLAHGKRGKGMVWVLVVVLIVFTYIGVMASTYVSIVNQAKDAGYELVDNAFWIVLTLPFTPNEDVGVIWGQLAMGWIFAGLGSFGLIRRANREGSGKDIAVNRIDR